MSELKTLKDLIKEVTTDIGSYIDIVEIEELRAEAVKWVKFLRENIDKESLCLECGKTFRVCHDFEETGNKPCGKAEYGINCLSNADYESTDILGAILILKKIHNITEEDLE